MASWGLDVSGNHPAQRGLRPPEAFSDRPHGTRLRYLSGCRCVPCRAANSSYESERLAARKRGEWAGIIAADRARAHLLELSRAGIGRTPVAEASGVSRTIIQEIRSGRRRRIRASTERRILAVDSQARADHSYVPAKKTWQLIRELLDEGFTAADLARRLGYSHPALQFRKTRVLAITAVRVEQLHGRLTR